LGIWQAAFSCIRRISRYKILRACFKNRSERGLRARRGGGRGAANENIPRGSSTEEQRPVRRSFSEGGRQNKKRSGAADLEIHQGSLNGGSQFLPVWRQPVRRRPGEGR
jgi:hypothetical protein